MQFLLIWQSCLIHHRRSSLPCFHPCSYPSSLIIWHHCQICRSLPGWILQLWTFACHEYQQGEAWLKMSLLVSAQKRLAIVSNILTFHDWSLSVLLWTMNPVHIRQLSRHLQYLLPVGSPNKNGHLQTWTCCMRLNVNLYSYHRACRAINPPVHRLLIVKKFCHCGVATTMCGPVWACETQYLQNMHHACYQSTYAKVTSASSNRNQIARQDYQKTPERLIPIQTYVTNHTVSPQ